MTIGDRLQLNARQWYGWQVVGRPAPQGVPWGVSPIFVHDVTPLKTGNGVMSIDATLLLRPLRPRRVQVTAKVLYHDPALLLVSWREDGQDRTVALAMLSPDWLRQNCAELLEARPPEWFFLKDDWGAEDYLNELVAPGGPDRMEGGASESSFGREKRDPTRWLPMRCDATFSGLSAWLILQGFVPRSMDDKWFIHAERVGDEGRLLYRRSWTGILVWEWRFRVSANELHFGEARVNAEGEYTYGTPEQERADLLWITGLLMLPRKQEYESPGRWTDHSPAEIDAAWFALQAGR